MAQYVPPNPEQQPNLRPPMPSSASNRYTPGGGYQPTPPAPAPFQQNEDGYFQQTRPRGPSIGNQPITPIPPTPQYGYGMSPGASGTPLPPPQPYALNQYPPYPADVDRDGYMRPPPEPRRLSAASAHSRPSGDRRRSNDSRRSHHSQRSSHSDGRRSRSRDPDRKKEHHHHRHNHDSDEDLKPVKRTNTHRPSWGDTIYSIYGTIKDALGPRDKY